MHTAPADAWFDTEFWPRYPRKEKKIAARDALRWAMQNHNQDGTLQAQILRALTWQIEVHSEWKYWTSPDRWILNQRWTDEAPARPKSQAEQVRDAKHSAAEQQAMDYWRKKHAERAS